jgi:hypothetical protein
MKVEDFTKLTPTELRVKLSNKQKAADNLSVWLSRHDKYEPEYKRVMEDRTELSREMAEIERLLKQKSDEIPDKQDLSFQL